jgi:hypothetical protein
VEQVYLECGRPTAQLMRDSLGSVMIYGDLRFRDRLVRAIVGAILGGGAAFLLTLRWDMRGQRPWGAHSSLLPATVIGAAIGAALAFRV